MDGQRGTQDAARAFTQGPRWNERLPLAVAAACGAVIASYLAAVQLGLVAAAWDPLFGPASSGRVLRSALGRALPVPDAAVGALGYLAEVVLALAGGPDRSRAGSSVAHAYGAVAALLGAAALFLAGWQAFAVRAGCTLCLASAALSVAIAIASWREVRGAAGALARRWRSFEHQHA